MGYAREMGAITRLLKVRHGRITPTALGNISAAPDLLPRFLRHLDISEPLPPAPDGWRRNAEESMDFWLGYYQELAKEGK